MFRNQTIQELKNQNVIKDLRIKQLEEQQEKLLDRLMAKDLTDLQAPQDDPIPEDEDEEKYEDLENVSQETIINAQNTEPGTSRRTS